MIRLCKETDRTQVLHYLYQDAAYNIFIIGDIEAFGFEQDFQRIYGEFNEDNELCSVFLRYREHAIYYADQTRFNPEYLEIMNNDPFDYISGKSELTALLEQHLPSFTKKEMYFCEASTLPEKPYNPSPMVKQLSTRKDCARLYDLLSIIDEFGIAKKSKDSFIDGKLQSLQMGTTLYIEQNGKIVSSVATTADTTINAMVVAVASHPDYRQKGYATILVEELMQRYIGVKGKSLCLFYDNPQAGAIYLRLGFHYIGQWTMYERREEL